MSKLTNVLKGEATEERKLTPAEQLKASIEELDASTARMIGLIFSNSTGFDILGGLVKMDSSDRDILREAAAAYALAKVAIDASVDIITDQQKKINEQGVELKLISMKLDKLLNNTEEPAKKVIKKKEITQEE